MKIQVVDIYLTATQTHGFIGAFSDPQIAVEKGVKKVEELLHKKVKLLDWDHMHPMHQYFYDGATLTVYETELDEE